MDLGGGGKEPLSSKGIVPSKMVFTDPSTRKLTEVVDLKPPTITRPRAPLLPSEKTSDDEASFGRGRWHFFLNECAIDYLGNLGAIGRPLSCGSS